MPTRGEPFALDPARSALLVLDMQNDFVREGAPQEVPQEVPQARLVIGTIATARARRPLDRRQADHRRRPRRRWFPRRTQASGPGAPTSHIPRRLGVNQQDARRGAPPLASHASRQGGGEAVGDAGQRTPIAPSTLRQQGRSCRSRTKRPATRGTGRARQHRPSCRPAQRESGRSPPRRTPADRGPLR
jgi:hypothetical protein